MQLTGGLTSDEFINNARGFLLETQDFEKFVESREIKSENTSTIMPCSVIGEDVCLDIFIGGRANPRIQTINGERVYTRVFNTLSKKVQIDLLKQTMKNMNIFSEFTTFYGPMKPEQEETPSLSKFFDRSTSRKSKSKSKKKFRTRCPNGKRKGSDRVCHKIKVPKVKSMRRCSRGFRRGVDAKCHKNKKRSTSRSR